ncbi:DUF305 domain-containing protein [Streptosporangium carneum]|uniref:DUF305 domain-containing protein n=1 Tax=Streptosporangium carneum TaxID=47481 RepID=A0A9W6I718_9ACTN|nr:DUF305 domain-containing protein [Streptosporangium carneum]GLK13307.1 DUF305 domain-containing protein [Streptosporangium carneum]
MLKRAVPIVLGAFLLTGCGAHSLQELQGSGQMTHGAHGAADAGPAAVAGSDYNPADVMFLQMMVPHNTEGVKLAKLAQERAVSSDVKTLAAAIATTQESEAKLMAGWLSGWKQPPTPSGNAHASHGGHGMTKAQFDALAKAPDAEFEKRFLNTLIAQQDDAVQMAKVESMAGQNAETKALAGRVEASRSAQIKQMLALVGQ